MRFKATIQIREGNPYVMVNATRAARLKSGWRKPLPVLVQINGQPEPAWRINMMPVGDGRFYLYLHGAVRKASQTVVGDRVIVDVAFDPKYRNGPMHSMPVWFSKPLKKNMRAKLAWDALTPSRKKEILRYLSWLKSTEARDRNVAKALHVLSGKTGRFLARTWKKGK